jgi:hypothetical protein
MLRIYCDFLGTGILSSMVLLTSFLSQGFCSDIRLTESSGMLLGRGAEVKAACRKYL